MANSIAISGINAGYGAVRVLEDVSLDVGSGETVVLLGTNGNGKSTLMKLHHGHRAPDCRPHRRRDRRQEPRPDRKTTEEIVDLGIALVPEGRRLFPKLTVEENLLLGAFRPTARRDISKNLEFCFDDLPNG